MATCLLLIQSGLAGWHCLEEFEARDPGHQSGVQTALAKSSEVPGCRVMLEYTISSRTSTFVIAVEDAKSLYRASLLHENFCRDLRRLSHHRVGSFHVSPMRALFKFGLLLVGVYRLSRSLAWDPWSQCRAVLVTASLGCYLLALSTQIGWFIGHDCLQEAHHPHWCS
jgi:hypothetical protein